VPEQATQNAEWADLVAELSSCRRCALCEGRHNVVVGRGSLTADVLLVGEAPGENEDLQGLPFVGRAGKLLDFALEGLMYPPGSYYIANIVKCRPPKNRAPFDDEAEVCLPYLRRQVRLIAPKIIVCLGAVATRHIVGKDSKITRDRGVWVERKGCSIMPTFHPAALLRDDNKKESVWQDLKKARTRLEEE
jgi:DNA polymerase